MSTNVIGQSLPRVDGRAKVTGAARYAAEFNQAGQAHAVIVSATIGLGRITEIDQASVAAMPGVVAVISHLNAPRLAYGPHKGGVDPAVGAADGDADGVHGDRVVASEIRQQFESMRIREKVLRMNLEPTDGWASGHHLRDVRKPKADTGPFRRVWSGVAGDGHVRSPRYFG